MCRMPRHISQSSAVLSTSRWTRVCRLASNVSPMSLLSTSSIAERQNHLEWFNLPSKQYFNRGCLEEALTQCAKPDVNGSRTTGQSSLLIPECALVVTWAGSPRLSLDTAIKWQSLATSSRIPTWTVFAKEEHAKCSSLISCSASVVAVRLTLRLYSHRCSHMVNTLHFPGILEIASCGFT